MNPSLSASIEMFILLYLCSSYSVFSEYFQLTILWGNSLFLRTFLERDFPAHLIIKGSVPNRDVGRALPDDGHHRLLTACKASRSGRFGSCAECRYPTIMGFCQLVICSHCFGS